MLIPLLVALTSLAYAAVAQPWRFGAVWLADWIALSAAAWLILRFLQLTLPHHRRGALLGAAFVVLIPRYVWLPYQDSPNAGLILLAAAAALVAARIHFRDGLKWGPLLVFGLGLGIGTALSPVFLQVLPWTVIPVWVTVSRARRFGALSLPLAAGLAGWAVTTWLAPGGVAGTAAVQVQTVPNRSPQAVADLVAAIGSPTLFVSGAVDALYATLSLVVVAGFFWGIRGATSQPEWRRPLRLSPVLALSVLVGLCSSLAWALWRTFWFGDPPRVDDLFLAKPWIGLIAAVGLANVTDWIRRQKKVGNLIAEHLVGWGLALHLLANAWCLYLLVGAGG